MRNIWIVWMKTKLDNGYKPSVVGIFDNKHDAQVLFDRIYVDADISKSMENYYIGETYESMVMERMGIGYINNHIPRQIQ